MPETDRKYRIFISAAEPSAEAHCAGLITALRQTTCDIEFVGVGGAKMADAGCKLLQSTADNAAMIYNAFAHIARFYKLIMRITAYLKSNKVDLVIVCDSPAFNFHIAKAAKKLGIKTLFYVAPQLWAWGGWRISKLRKYCDKLCCILPFEQNWFSEKGVDATFVGNPLLDGPAFESAGGKTFAEFEPKNSHFALLPGSRSAEINSLWRPMQQIALRLKRKYPNAAFTAAAVSAEKKEVLRSFQIPNFKCRYIIGSVGEVASAADFTIVASGSATLEVAAAGCPMVIMYQSNKILWHLLGRHLLKTKYLSLVNILAERELVPEFMPYFDSIEPIVETIERLLEDKSQLIRISGELVKLAEPLRRGDAAKNVAKITAEMLEGVRSSP